MNKLAFSILLVLFILNKSFSQKSIKVLDKSDILTLSKTTLEKADAIFTEMDTLSLFKMSDCNNCEDRANAIAYILNKRGLTVAKFWLFGEGKISTGTDSYLLKSKKCGTWGYHVATGFLAESNGKTDTIIIDPGTQRSAVSVKAWALPLIQERKIGHLIVKDFNYYTYPVKDDKFLVDAIWTEKDTNLWRTAKGLCGWVLFGASKKRTQAKLDALLITQ